MLDEFQKSVRRVLTERIVNPFLGSFTLAWLLWNWQILFYLWREDTKVSPLKQLENIVTLFENPTYNFWLPLASAFGYAFVYPLLSLTIIFVWEFADEQKRKMVQYIHRNQLLSFEQSTRLLNEIHKVETKLAETIASKDAEILRLRASVANEGKPDPQPQLPTADPRWDAEYARFRSSKFYESFGDIVNDLTQDYQLPSNVDQAVTYLVANDIIEKQEGERSFRLTAKGRYFSRRYHNEPS